MKSKLPGRNSVLLVRQLLFFTLQCCTSNCSLPNVPRPMILHDQFLFRGVGALGASVSPLLPSTHPKQCSSCKCSPSAASPWITKPDDLEMLSLTSSRLQVSRFKVSTPTPAETQLTAFTLPQNPSACATDTSILQGRSLGRKNTLLHPKKTTADIV